MGLFDCRKATSWGVQKVADHIVALNNLAPFIPQNLSNILWAYATAKDAQPRLFGKLAVVATKRKNEFNSQDVANFLWSCSANGQIDQHLFSSFVPATKSLINKCNSQNLANIAWVYAVADIDAPSLFNDGFIHTCLEKEKDFIIEHLRQLYQWHLWQEELKSK